MMKTARALACALVLVGTVGVGWAAGWFWRLGVRNYTGASA